MPCKHLLKNLLPTAQDRIPVTRHHILEAPAVNALNTLPEALTISFREYIPQHAFLPHSIPPRIHDAAKQPRRPPRRRVPARFGVLFRGREIEEQIGLDERTGRFVEEHELFIGMSVYELIFKLGVKFGGHGDRALVFCREGYADGDVGYGFVFCGERGSFLGEAFRREDLCAGIGGGPGREEDVVF